MGWETTRCECGSCAGSCCLEGEEVQGRRFGRFDLEVFRCGRGCRVGCLWSFWCRVGWLVAFECRCRVGGLVGSTDGSDWVVLVQVQGRRAGGSDLVGFWCRCRVGATGGGG